MMQQERRYKAGKFRSPFFLSLFFFLPLLCATFVRSKALISSYPITRVEKSSKSSQVDPRVDPKLNAARIREFPPPKIYASYSMAIVISMGKLELT